MTLDIEFVRSQFPTVTAERVFFDNPGGSQIVQQSIDRMQQYLMEMNANRGGVFPTSRQSDRTLNRARQAVADFLNASRPEEIIFGPNMTSLTLALSRSLATQFKPGDELIVTRLDHDANISPWIHVAEASGCRLHWVDFDIERCALDTEGYFNLLSDRTRLVALGYASNAVGTINPIPAMIEAAHEVGALTYIDAVQQAPHGAIDVQALDCDFLVFSAYKVFGPHLGMLYGKYKLLDDLPPFKVRPAPERPPGKFETGTQNHEGIVAMLGTLEYLADLGRRFSESTSSAAGTQRGPDPHLLRAGMRLIEEYERDLNRICMDVISSLPNLQLFGFYDEGEVDARVPTFALRADPIQPRQLARRLSEHDIYVWDGNFYALAVTERLGVESKGGLVRIGLVHYNTVGEVNKLGNVLESILKSNPPT